MSAAQELALQEKVLERALRPLSDPPQPPGWNHAEMSDLLGTEARTPAAVLVPVVRHATGAAVLFTVRNEAMRQHAGQVSFPGGRAEADDLDAIDTALRETHEETGIAREKIRPVGFLDSFETISGFCVTPVVGYVSPDYTLQPDPDEVSAVFEVPLAFLLDMANLHSRHIEWRGRPREVFEYLYEGRRIWGATAAMLVNLRHRLERAA
jgi:8-oxo-dGTP pyrophosphatase MutT (NUDIX family)